MEFLKKFSKKQIIITTVAAVVVVLAAIIAVVAFNGGEKKKSIESIKNDEITISGELGDAYKLTNEELSESLDEYKNVAEKIKDDSLIAFSCTDITIYDKDNKKVQPAGKVKITMAIPDSIKSGSDYEYDIADDVYKVFRSESDNSVTELQGELSADKKTITFETAHFSVYTIAKYNKGKCEIKTENIDDFITTMDKTMYVVNDTTAYDGPNSTWNSIGTLTKGQEVKVVGQYQENNWYKIQYSENVVGYVSELDLSEQPVVEETQATAEEPANTDTNNESENTDKNNSSSKNNGGSSTKKNTGSSNSGNSGNESSTTQQQTPPAQPEQQPQQPQEQKPAEQGKEPQNCPFPLLTWTTHNGHYGFFATGAQSSQGGKAMDMAVELSLKGEVHTEYYYFDDTGEVIFLYN